MTRRHFGIAVAILFIPIMLVGVILGLTWRSFVIGFSDLPKLVDLISGE